MRNLGKKKTKKQGVKTHERDQRHCSQGTQKQLRGCPESKDRKSVKILPSAQTFLGDNNPVNSCGAQEMVEDVTCRKWGGGICGGGRFPEQLGKHWVEHATVFRAVRCSDARDG